MNVPVNIQENIQPYWIYLTWSDLVDLTDTGRDPPTYYHLQWDRGSEQSAWYDLTTENDGFFLNFNMTSETVLPNNTVVYFQVRAKNGVGYGPYSNKLAVLCGTTPTFMNIPVNYTTILYN